MARRHSVTVHTPRPRGNSWRTNLPAHTSSTLHPTVPNENFVTDTLGNRHYYRQPGQTAPRHPRKPRKTTR